MKILLVCDQFFDANNGMTISARRFARELVRHGNEVRVLGFGEPKTKDFVQGYFLPKQYIPIFDNLVSSQGMTFAKPVMNVLSEALAWPDVVHFQTPFILAMECIRLLNELKKPYTAAFHVQPENITSSVHLGKAVVLNDLIYYWFNTSVFRYCKHIHCPSEFIAAQLRAHGYKQRLHVISNGIDPDFSYARQEKPPELRDKFVLLSTGRFSVEKRQDVIIEGVARSKYREKIKLMLAGRGPRRDKLAALALARGVDVDMSFHKKEELIDIIHTSDLYVHAADAEIEAMACMEAFAGGLVPVIADSPMSATPQFALDERSIFKHGDAKSLAEKIDYWLDNPSERERMGREYSLSAKNYRLDACVRKAEEMFKAAIEENEAAENAARTHLSF